MLTTSEQEFVADASKLASTRPVVSSYPWSDSPRPYVSRQFGNAPVDGAPESTAVDVPAAPSLALDISSRFGLRLRELRRERNLTQLRMAREFGIDRSFISDVERGRKSISLPMLEVIALGMKVSLSELLRDL